MKVTFFFMSTKVGFQLPNIWCVMAPTEKSVKVDEKYVGETCLPAVDEMAEFVGSGLLAPCKSWGKERALLSPPQEDFFRAEIEAAVATGLEAAATCCVARSGSVEAGGLFGFVADWDDPWYWKIRKSLVACTAVTPNIELYCKVWVEYLN